MVKLLILLTFLLPTVFASDPIKIAIIDTGLDIKDYRFKDVLCAEGHVDFTGEGIEDREGHGTHIAGLVARNSRYSSVNYCLIILKYYSSNYKSNYYNYIYALKEAIAQKVKVVNISAGGPNDTQLERLIFKNHPEIKFVVAAGNDSKNLKEDNWYPAKYPFPNIISVGSLTVTGKISSFSNYGNDVKIWEIGENLLSTLPGGLDGYMSGTSQATAIHTGKLIRQGNL